MLILSTSNAEANPNTVFRKQWPHQPDYLPSCISIDIYDSRSFAMGYGWHVNILRSHMKALNSSREDSALFTGRCQAGDAS